MALASANVMPIRRPSPRPARSTPTIRIVPPPAVIVAIGAARRDATGPVGVPNFPRAAGFSPRDASDPVDVSVPIRVSVVSPRGNSGLIRVSGFTPRDVSGLIRVSVVSPRDRPASTDSDGALQPRRTGRLDESSSRLILPDFRNRSVDKNGMYKHIARLMA